MFRPPSRPLGKRRVAVAGEEAGRELAEGPGRAGRSAVEAQHDVEARAVEFARLASQIRYNGLHLRTVYPLIIHAPIKFLH